jgi:hypothetical protein
LVLKFSGELMFTPSLESFMVQVGPHEQGTGLGFPRVQAGRTSQA